jgi:hypothetical protein
VRGALTDKPGANFVIELGAQLVLRVGPASNQISKKDPEAQQRGLPKAILHSPSECNNVGEIPAALNHNNRHAIVGQLEQRLQQV